MSSPRQVQTAQQRWLRDTIRSPQHHHNIKIKLDPLVVIGHVAAALPIKLGQVHCSKCSFALNAVCDKFDNLTTGAPLTFTPMLKYRLQLECLCGSVYTLDSTADRLAQMVQRHSSHQQHQRQQQKQQAHQQHSDAVQQPMQNHPEQQQPDNATSSEHR